MRETNQTARKTVVTKAMIIEALKSIGLRSNMVIEVHSSLASFGYVVGGARTVVDALMEVVGEGGTILMPAHTLEYSDPSEWKAPSVCPETWKDIREGMPAYNPELVDYPQMGQIVENFRRRPGVVCSNHPNVAYLAWGRYSKLLCNRQSMHFPLAEESPSARLYELRGYILLLGTDFSEVTCMNLAEYRTESRPIIVKNACMVQNGRKIWKKYLNLDLDDSVFEKVRESLVKKSMINETMLDNCHIQFFPAYIAIDETVQYFEQNSVYDLYR